MKYITLYFLLFYSICNAQFSFGPKAAIIISNSQIDGSSRDEKFSIAPGAFMEFKFSRFALLTEVDYAVIGSKYGSGKTNFETINVYVMPELYLSKKFAFEVGPYYQQILSVKTINGITKDRSIRYQKFDAGLAAGFKFVIFKGLFTEARYSFGLTNVSQGVTYILRSGNFDPYTDGTPSNKVRNHFLSISAGYAF